MVEWIWIYCHKVWGKDKLLHLKNLKGEGKTPSNTLVCGDSGNDAELFSIPGVYGGMVSNAQEELLQWHAQNAKDNPKIVHSSERCAAGIIETIGLFKFCPNLPFRDISDFAYYDLQNGNPAAEVVRLSMFFEKWMRAEIENCEMYIASLKAACHPSAIFVHPSGTEQPLSEWANTLKKCYGDKKGKQYQVWVDQVLATRQVQIHGW